ncbi:trypsin-like peptidase domain-containing protein [Bacteriovoracales bacterium]|nr:trypsin-like peptidase domain-containing protein [Bacteriovoracales bacterium]
MNSFEKIKWTLVLLLLTGCLEIDQNNKKFLSGKVIYGTDDRYDVEDFPLKRFRKYARSTAAQISRDILKKEGDFYSLRGKKLSDKGICKEEKFSNQVSPANCSGFLVGEDILVTAGHCMQSEEDCLYYQWVFGFKKGKDSMSMKKFPLENVYSCKKILVSKYDPIEREDYAVVKLDRAVFNREPLKFRKRGKIADETSVIAIGHPSGLPTKIAGNARVRQNGHTIFFNANLDTFAGNSGSPVFNKKSGLVEGILVRGDTDYVTENSCMVSNRCKNEECRGEDVTRMTFLKDIKKIIKDNKKKSLNILKGHLSVFSKDIPIELPDKGVLNYRFELEGKTKIRSLEMEIKVFHPLINDLDISIIHPSGEEIALDKEKGYPQLVLDKVFFDDDQTSGFLSPLVGLKSEGTWILKIEDGVHFDKGQLEYFSFRVN